MIVMAVVKRCVVSLMLPYMKPTNLFDMSPYMVFTVSETLFSCCSAVLLLLLPYLQLTKLKLGIQDGIGQIRPLSKNIRSGSGSLY